MLEDTLENKLYIDALKSLEKHNLVSEHHKVAKHHKEIDFMHNANQMLSRSSMTIPYTTGQYEKIFRSNA